MANRFARYVEQAPANRFAKYSQLEQDEPARTPDTSFFREPVNVGGRVGVGSADSVGGAELESDGFNLAALDSINVVPRGVGRLAQTGALAAGLGRDVLAESQNSDTVSPFGILLRRALGGAQPKETKGLLAAEEISRDLQRNIDERFPKPQAQAQTERELSQATGVMDTLGALVRNPVGSMQLAGESLASSLPAIRAAGIVAGSGLASGASATSAGEEFDNEFAQFQQTPMFEALRRAIGDENVAKYAEREKARRIQQSLIGSTVGGAATAGVTSRIGLNPIDQAIAGRAGALSSRIPATIRETAGEAVEGGGTQAITNLFTGADPLQDVATSATMEAALGGLTAAPVDIANAGSRVAGLLSDIGDIGTQAADLTRQAQARATTDRILGRATPPQTPQEAQTDAGAGIAEAAVQNALAARPVVSTIPQNPNTSIPTRIENANSFTSPVAQSDMRENDELDRLLVGALGGVEDGQTVSDQLRPDGDTQAGVRSAVSSVPVDLPDGTYFIPGDPAAIRQRLADAGVETRGVVRTIDERQGVRFGANTRGQVLGVLGGVREVNSGAVSGDASSAEPLGTGRSSSNVDVSGAAESRSTLGAQAGQGGGIPAASSAQGLGLDEGAAAALAGRPDGLLQNRAVSSPTQAEAAVDAQFTLEELTKAAPELESALSRGMLPHIDVATAGNGTSYYAKAVGTIDTDRRLRLSPTAEERKAAQQAAADIELADSQEERDAAKVRLREVLRPAAERAVSAALSPTQRTDGAVRDDILSALPSVQDQSPAQRVSAQSLGADYTDRLLSLMGARKSGAMTEAERDEYTALLEQDRETGKVNGRPMVGVGNKTGYVDALSQGRLRPVQVFTDADQFKLVNDKLGHDVGDEVIRLYGKAMIAEFGQGRVWHRGGDEFLADAETDAEADAAMARVAERMRNIRLEVPLSDGRTAVLEGIGVSYGKGATEKDADEGLKRDKERRKRLGLRADRQDADSRSVDPQPDGAWSQAGRADSRRGDGAQGAAAAAEGVAREDSSMGRDRAGSVASDGRVGLEAGRGAEPVRSGGTDGRGSPDGDARSGNANASGRAGSVSAAGDRADGGSRIGAVRSAVSRALGSKFLRRLESQPWFNLVESLDQLPPDVRKSISGDDIAGFVLPDGRVFIIAENVGDNATGIVLHEVGVHFGMAGLPDFPAMLAQFKRMRPRDGAVARAYESVPKDTPAELVDEEAFAYFIEANWNAKTPLMTRIMDAVAMLLNRLGVPMSRIDDALKRQTLRGMIAKARAAAEDAAGGRISVRDGKLAYHTKSQGAPKFVPGRGVIRSGTILYHGTRGDLDPSGDAPLYLTDRKDDAAAYAAGLIPGTGKSRKGTFNVIEFAVSHYSGVLDANKRINDAVAGESEETVEDAINGAIEEARRDGYSFVWFEHPSIRGDEMNALIAVDWRMSVEPADEYEQRKRGARYSRRADGGPESLRVVAAGDVVDGRTVREGVPNQSSIASSLDDYTILKGIREVPMSAFDKEYVEGIAEGRIDNRTQALADAIAASKEIAPLIVAYDADGAYIIEGGHRLDALIKIGAKSLPAMVVIDEANPPKPATREGLGASGPRYSRRTIEVDGVERPTADGRLEQHTSYAVFDAEQIKSATGNYVIFDDSQVEVKAKYSRRADGGSVGGMDGKTEEYPTLPAGILSQEQMLARGAGGHLARAFERYIEVAKIDGREPTPGASDDIGYVKGRFIADPIEVEYDSSEDRYVLYAGNHRVTQAEVNGDKFIRAFVQPDRGRIGKDSTTLPSKAGLTAGTRYQDSRQAPPREGLGASWAKYSRRPDTIDVDGEGRGESAFRELMRGDIAQSNFRRVINARLGGEKFDYEIRRVRVEDVKPSQFGEDYDNDSSRETARRISDGSVIDARAEDVYPIEVDANGTIIDGNHRHAAAVMNGDKTILALVPVSSGSGKVLNLDSIYPTDSRIAYSRRTRERPLGLDDAPELTRSIADLWNSASDVLRKVPTLRPLATAIDAYFDSVRKRLGQVNGILRPAIKASTKEDQNAFERYQEMAQRGDFADARAELAEMTPEGRALVEAWDKVAKLTGDQNDSVGVKVFDARTNAWRPIGRVRNFWPRRLKRQFRDAMRSPHKYPADWNLLVNILLDSGRITDVSEAREYLNNYFAEDSANDYFAGIERARSEPLPLSLYDYSLDTAVNYKDRWADRISQIEHFGQKTGPNSEDLFDKVKKAVTDERTQRYIKRVQDSVEQRKLHGLYDRMMLTMRTIATGLMLGNPATASLNIIGGLSMNQMVFPMDANLRASARLLTRYGESLREAIEVGALVDDYYALATDALRAGLNERLANFTQGALKIGGYSATEFINRTHAFLAGKYFLQGGLAAINRNARSRKSKLTRAFLQRNGFDVEKLLAEQAEETKPETERWLRYATNLTQFSYNIDQTPVFIDEPTGKFLFQFQKFGTQMNRLLWQQILKPFFQSVFKGGEPYTIKDADGREAQERVRNFWPVVRFFAAAVPGGLLVQAVRQLLFGYGEDGPDEDELRRKLANGQYAAAVAMAAEKAGLAVIALGAFGFIGNYAQMARDVTEQQRVKNPLEPPGTAVIQSVGQLVLNIASQGELTLHDVDKFIEQNVSFYRTSKRLGGTFGEWAGSDADFVRLESARREFNHARYMARRYADQVGIEARRTATGDFLPTERSPTTRAVREALLMGNPESARAIAYEYLKTLDSEKEVDNALASIKAAIRAGQPSLVPGAPSDRERRSFLRWAEANLTREGYLRIKGLDDAYRSAADRSGLWSPREVSARSEATADGKERTRSAAEIERYVKGKVR